MYNIRNGTIRWKIYHFLSDGNSNDFALSLTVCEIFAKLEKFGNFQLENEGQGQHAHADRTRRPSLI